MRTLHILPLSTPGGVEIMFINFLKELKQRDPVLFSMQYVCCITYSDLFKRELEKLGANVLLINANGEIPVINNYKMILDFIKNNDIKQIYGQNFIGAFFTSLVKIRLGKKIVSIIHEHGSAWSSNTKNLFINYVSYLTADRIICNSNASKYILNLKYRINLKKVDVIYNGIKLIDYITHPKTNDLIYVGRLVKDKSIITIIDALIVLKKTIPNIKLQILGDGIEREELVQYVKRNNLEENVRFLGHVSNVNDYISASKILINSSVRESLGNVIIEAGMLSVPSIGPNIDGIPEVIMHKGTGFIIDPEFKVNYKGKPKFVFSPTMKKLDKPKSLNPLTLADKILYLLSDDKYIEMGKAAKKNVAEKFDFNFYFIQIIKYLKS